MKTTYRQNSRTFVASALAVVVALASTAALGRAMSSSDDYNDDAPGKAEACGAIGCPNGSRLCGSIGGKLGAVIPPFSGEISVSWTCYEGVVL